MAFSTRVLLPDRSLLRNGTGSLAHADQNLATSLSESSGRKHVQYLVYLLHHVKTNKKLMDKLSLLVLRE